MTRPRVTDEMLTAAMNAYCEHTSGRPDPDRLRVAIQAALDSAHQIELVDKVVAEQGPVLSKLSDR